MDTTTRAAFATSSVPTPMHDGQKRNKYSLNKQTNVEISLTWGGAP